MQFRYKVKKRTEYSLNEYIVSYDVEIQMFDNKKSKWKSFRTVNLLSMLKPLFKQERTYGHLHQFSNEYLVACNEMINSVGGFEVALKVYINSVLKEINESNENAAKEEAAINSLDSMFSSKKKWTVIELNEE